MARGCDVFDLVSSHQKPVCNWFLYLKAWVPQNGNERRVCSRPGSKVTWWELLAKVLVYQKLEVASLRLSLRLSYMDYCYPSAGEPVWLLKVHRHHRKEFYIEISPHAWFFGPGLRGIGVRDQSAKSNHKWKPENQNIFRQRARAVLRTIVEW